MLNSGSLLAENLLMASLYSLIFAAIVYLISYVFSLRFRSIQAWPAFWLTGIVCTALSLIIGMLPADYRHLTQWPLYHTAMPAAAATAIPADPIVIESGALAELKAQLAAILRDLAPIWLVIYVAGLVSKSALLLCRYLKVLKIVSNAEVVDPVNQARINKLLPCLADVDAKKFIKQNKPRMLTTNAVYSPFVISLPKPTLIISKTAFERLSDAQLALVLEHELIHLANRDPLLLMAVGWLSNLLWFNPFVQQLGKRTRLSVELNCDARTLANRGDAKHHYLGAILSVINAGHNANLKLNTATFGGSTAMFIKARIHRIQNPLLSHTNPTLRKVWLVFGLLAIVATNSALQPSAFAQSADNEDALIKQLQLGQPVQAGKVSSHFGPRIDPFTREQRVHNGIDYAAKHGVPVIATGDGQVIFAGDKGDYGLRIDIDHGGRVSTLYANLGEILVEKGQRVQQGDTIATMGVSGRSTGPHVHYEVRDNGQPVCPSEQCIVE